MLALKPPLALFAALPKAMLALKGLPEALV